MERTVNVIVDSVGSVFLPKCYPKRFSYPKATVIWVESDATSWVKMLIRYQSMSSLENHYQRKM
jgi:hypothetical protein